VSELEAQVERLTLENQELRTRLQATPVTDESPTSNESPSHFQDLVKSVRNVVVEPSRQPRFLGQSSGITLAKLVMAAIRVDALPAPVVSTPHSFENSSSALAAEVSLPPRHAADHLVEVYFQYRTPHLPILERSQVEKAVESTYLSLSGQPPSDRAAENDIFTTYMIFAIALCDVPNPSGGRPSQSEGCFRSAIGWIEKIITLSRSDVETLRVILLLAQFVALCPSYGSLWHLAGTALRLCIDTGLHWEAEEQTLNIDPSILHERRCLWYSTYQLDRILCITLGRPFGIIEESIRVPLPNPWTSRRSLGRKPYEFDVHNQRAHNHLFSMSKLESEIRHVLHSKAWTPKVAYPKPNYSTWVQDIQPRLQEWYSTIPEPSKAHPSSIFACQAYWDAIYNNAILLLHRPHSIVQHASTEALFISFEASCKLIVSIKVLQREGKVDVLWRTVHHLFMAGLGLIYCLWYSKEIRDHKSVGSSISTLQSCSSTLSALSENFPGAAGCRDIFDILSSATVDWLVTNNAEETRQSRLEFEKQVEDLMQQLQSSRGGNDNSANDMSTILSTDNFAFGEMLSSAAQWPNFEDLNLSSIGSDSLNVTGFNSGPYIFS
jgi:hypothetical protein